MNNIVIRIITGLIGVVVLGAIAGGVYWFFVSSETSSDDASSESFFARTFRPLFGVDVPTDVTPPQSTSTPTTSTGLPRFFQVWPEPVAGAYAFGASTTDIVRVVDAGTGHLFDVSLENGEARRVTNTTIPGIMHVHWRGADSLIVQYINSGSVDTVRSFNATVVYPETTAASTDVVGELVGEFLPDNIDVLATHNDQFAYMIDGRLVYNNQTIFESPLHGWQLDWIDDSTLLVTSNASSETDGIAYRVTTSGVVTRIIEPTRALTARADEGVLLMSSGIDIFVQTSNEESDVYFDVQALPEKCISDSAVRVVCGTSIQLPTIQNLPEVWYQGVLHFTDTLWEIDTVTGEAVEIGIPQQAFDIVPLSVAPNTNAVLFSDKTTGTAWVYFR